MSCDLLIIGGGPAGLSAAINAASEGLLVKLMDAASLGGQAKESNAIENYPGFPDGITGLDLMDRLVKQSRKFDVSFSCPVTASRIEKLENGEFRVTGDDYQQFYSKAVLLTIGLHYRRHEAEGISEALNAGVYYGLPAHQKNIRHTSVAVVGGANSAGQAVMKLAGNAGVQVKMVIRKKLEDQMSTYLIDRIKRADNVEVCEGCEVTKIDRRGGTLRLTVTGYKDESMDVSSVFIYIGASPRTLWLQGVVMMDEKNFIVTGSDYQTSVPGLFAAGDVRAGSTKRIASSSGEGSAVVPYIHRYLSQRGQA